ncbi:hypothetical protein DENIS_2723 [Desulfonema ishimotonii]|uniref:Fungal lipase-type domain-containing protein n=1 Tax=Desulfonema ishimotonii TaxID=45657 RepID=A0A401FXR8_9BACT|nr:lipase family protein [Desulfonema ishimotonii]GBC61761.1 hypothetical protein DENIS_2723 [Desulfonema ishimotonii]
MNFDNSWNALIRPGDATAYFCAEDFRGSRPPPFQPESARYSPANAWWLSEICRLIYRRGEDEAGAGAAPVGRDEILRQSGLKEYCFLNRQGIQCAVVTPAGGTEHPFAVLVFRGTNSFDSWLSNLNAIQVRWPFGGMVHSGFRKEFYKVWPELDEILSDIRVPLFYTGHSLGGALATLAASHRPPLAVYTFGSPKVGDPVFAESLKEFHIFRLANHRDIVPAVPPSRIPFDFCHVGELRLLDGNDDAADGGEACDETTAPDNGPYLLRAGRFYRRHMMGPPEFLSDHAPVNYTARLVRELCGHMPAKKGGPP